MPVFISDAWCWINSNYQGLLVVGAVVGLGLATWRSFIAGKQAKTALIQAEIAKRQAEMSFDTLTTSQYKTGAELLSSEKVMTRLAGIVILIDLMNKGLPDYHVVVMRLFVAFLNNPPPNREFDIPGVVSPLQPDIKEVIDVINKTGDEERSLEEKRGFSLRASLSGEYFVLRNKQIQPTI